MTDLTCERVREDNLAAQYVTGNLNAEDADRFEEHMLLCAECQTELRFLSGIIEEMKPESPTRTRASRAWWALPGVAAAVLLLALGNALRTTTDLSALGHVDAPPIYLGVPVRASGEGDSLFLRGIREYDRGNYGAAATILDSARMTGDRSAPTVFFLGASLMMIGDNDAAATAFREVIERGRTSYVPESRYYLAKILLRTGNPESALSELEALGESPEVPIAAQAQALSDSLLELRQR